MPEHVRPWVRALQEDLDHFRSRLRGPMLSRADRFVYELQVRRLSYAIDALVLGAIFYAASLRARSR